MSTLTHKSSPSRAACRLVAVCSLTLALVAGCGRDDRILEIGAEALYEQGAEQLRAGNFAGAIISFENLRIRYPLTPITRQSQLDLLYAYYRSNQPEAAIDIAETFIRENPRLPEVAYALYMTGLIYFDDEENFLERWLDVDVSQRPPKESMLSFTAFQDLIRQYPQSPYVGDARQRMIFLRNRLATYENHVARYYMRRGAYVAAVNRAKYAVEHYPGAPELEEALRIMVEAYNALGMTDLAADAERIYEENFGELAAAVQ